MSLWMNWLELEKYNVWANRDTSDAEAATWDSRESALFWEKRSQNDGDAAREQVALMNIGPEDSVIDLCCGTGPTTEWIAKKAKFVTAFDYSEEMMNILREKADKQGLDNIRYLQGNWFSMEPGKDIPVHDIAVARYSFAQADLLKMSKCARKYCYSVWNVAPGDSAPHPILAIRALSKPPKGGAMGGRRKKPEPDLRLYGYNIDFNLLYDLGANPTLQFTTTVNTRRAASFEELCLSLFTHTPTEEQMVKIREAVKPLAEYEPDGTVCWRYRHKVAIVGWDPNEIDYELLNR